MLNCSRDLDKANFLVFRIFYYMDMKDLRGQDRRWSKLAMPALTSIFLSLNPWYSAEVRCQSFKCPYKTVRDPFHSSISPKSFCLAGPDLVSYSLGVHMSNAGATRTKPLTMLSTFAPESIAPLSHTVVWAMQRLTELKWPASYGYSNTIYVPEIIPWIFSKTKNYCLSFKYSWA